MANYQGELTEDDGCFFFLSKFIEAKMKNNADWIPFLSKVLFYKEALQHVYGELVKQSQ